MKQQSICASLILSAYLFQIAMVPIVLANAPVLNSATPGVNFQGVGTSNMTITSTALRSIVNAPLGFDMVRTDTTNVIQAPNASMMIRIGGLNPTSIDGHLNAIGQLILLNPNGVIFGPNAQINVGGLIASSLHLSNENFMRGYYLFEGAGIEGPVRNLGRINGAYDGVYLLAPNVENSGVITSAGGSIVLAAGAKAYLSSRPDGQGFLAEISAPIGQAVNVRDLIADGGTITLAGRVVNQQGLVQANSVQTNKGRIELIAKQPDSALSTDPSAGVTLGVGSVTRADGGSITVSGQTVTHQGALQANGGTVELMATVGAQAGSGVLITSAGSSLMADGGSIRLAGDRITHGGTLQANTANGRPGTVDVAARGATASLTTTAGSRIAADGGDIVLEGKVIDHGGAIQADAVGDRNGHVTFFGGDRLTFRSTSSTLSRGTATGVLDGGTIIGMASNVGGAVTVESGAQFDLSPATASGSTGTGGVLWLGDRRQNLGLIGTGTVTGASETRLIPIDRTVNDLSEVGSKNDVSLVALNDLTITGYQDLGSLRQGTAQLNVRFIAGRDVSFRDLVLGNNPFGPPAKWDIVGLAERSILFTGFTGSTLQTAHGGGIALQARTGNVNLIDPQTGALSTVRTQDGGGISIRTGLDLIASTGFDDNGGPLGLFNIRGINIEGPGQLNLNVGRDFIGGPVDGVPRGPGFVLWNSDLTVTPHHTVMVGGKIGETNLTLGPDGLPLTGTAAESSARYADFALSGGELTASAGGNVYVGRIRDAGLVGGLDAQGNPRDPQFAAGLGTNKVTIVSRDGNVILNTNVTDAGRQATPLEVLSTLLPASFEARADKGTIQIRSNLKFLPSPTGSVKFTARQDIQGVPKLIRGDDPNFMWLYVGYGGMAGGQWEAIDRRTIPQRPDLWPFLSNIEGSRTLPREAGTAPAQRPEYARIDVDGNPPTVKLLEVSPNDLIGNSALDQVAALVNNNRPAADNPTSLAQVSFKAELGNISKLFLDLVSRPFRKQIAIEAGNRIEQFNANIYLPNLGGQTQTVTEHVPLFIDPLTNQPRPITSTDVILIRDPATGAVRSWDKTEPVDPVNLVNVVFRDATVNVTSPIAAATITAQDIVLNTSNSGNGGLQFFGAGTGRVIATRNLDLADGRGINLDRNRASDQGGLLDIAVGNNLDMVTSGIFSRNGAGISIHGYDETRSYIIGYDNSALYPLEFPDSARGGINLPAAGGRLNVGENSPRSAGGSKAPTGIQVVNGGSVGQMAREPVVNSDGTVTVNVANDPAAILVRARGDIDVNKSRIATFGGGDIRLTSTQGNINAGSGGKDEKVLFSVNTGEVDSQGQAIFHVYEVPGSGIFTFHPADPQPLVYPTFYDPEINALLAQANREGFFGRDVSQLNARANQLRAAREPVFNQTVLNPFIDRLRLGDITLTAEKGNIIIPPAGIRGRNVDLIAPHGVVDFRGGDVVGRVRKIPPIIVGTPSIPVLAPPGVAPAPPPLSGGGTAAAASATAAASSTSAKNSDQVQESTSESSSQHSGGKQVASKKGDDKDGKSQVAQSVRVKRGVVIQVDVKQQAQQGS